MSNCKYCEKEIKNGDKVAITHKDCFNKIADLEAKLSESEEELLQKEKKIEDLMLCEFVATILDFNKLSADNCRLREQLAEKEKEIETLKKCGDTEHFYGLLEDKRKENKILIKTIEQANQDKISFAVETLEKVKEEAKHYGYEFSKSMHEYIDNQIKQLKEMK